MIARTITHPICLRLIPWAVLSLTCLTGCINGTAGDLEARKTGDLSDPPAQHEGVDKALTIACGAGGPTEAGLTQLVRHPYLQQMTATSVQVLVATAGGPAPELIVTQPDGSYVTALQATEAHSPPDAESPLWLATIEALAPSTIYCYEVAGLTRRTGFKTAPARGSEDSVRFVAFGDSGTGDDDQRAVRDAMMQVRFDLFLHTGDVAYNEGSPSQLEASFFDVYRELIAKVPGYPTLGNHDYETEAGAPYLRAFSLPNNGAPAGEERWYSFEWGSIHFVALDTQRVGPEQIQWLDDDLSANELPWKIAYFHKPPYSHGRHGGNDSVRAAFVPIFEKYGVQLVLSGHEHNYERFKPKNGVHYVVTGGGGNLTRPVGAGSDTAFSEAVLHFVLVEADRQRLLLRAIDGTGQEFDSLLITGEDS